MYLYVYLRINYIYIYIYMTLQRDRIWSIEHTLVIIIIIIIIIPKKSGNLKMKRLFVYRKFHPTTRHEGTGGENTYSYTLPPNLGARFVGS